MAVSKDHLSEICPFDSGYQCTDAGVSLSAHVDVWKYVVGLSALRTIS